MLNLTRSSLGLVVLVGMMFLCSTGASGYIMPFRWNDLMYGHRDFSALQSLWGNEYHKVTTNYVMPFYIDNLMLGLEDFSAPVSLQRVEFYKGTTSVSYRTEWRGKKGSKLWVDIEVSVCQSNEYALRRLWMETISVAVSPHDVTSIPPYSSLGEKCYAWHRQGLVFVRGNVVCDVYATGGALDLARKLALRVEAADDGLPFTARVLPVPADGYILGNERK